MKISLNIISPEKAIHDLNGAMWMLFTCSQRSCPPAQPGEFSPTLQYGVCRHKLPVHTPSAYAADLPKSPTTQHNNH